MMHLLVQHRLTLPGRHWAVCARHSRFIATTVLLLTAAACSKDSPTKPATAGPPAKVTVVSGDAQSGLVGQELASPVVVTVSDANGRPIEGQAVNFRVTAGGGSVFAGASVSNSDGMAQERWTLGTLTGVPQTLEARAVDNSTGQALVFATFHATATPDAAVAVALQTQPATTAKSGEILSLQPAARITDKYGNVVARSGVQITAAVAPPANGRSLSGTTSIATNDGGVATFRDLAVLGGVGPIMLAFSASGLTTVSSNAVTLSAGSPAQLVADGPASFSGIVGAPLATLPRAVVHDADGNTVAGVTVNFAVTNGGGTIAPTSSTTDANGDVSLTNWTLPNHAGTYSVVASASAIAGASVTFSAMAGAAVAATVARSDQSAITGQAGATLSPIQFRVADSFGNPVPSVTVTFGVSLPGSSVSSGGMTGQSASAITDANGLASVTWTLGTAAGQQTLVVSIVGATPLTVSATTQAGAAVRVTLSRPPSTSTVSGVALATQPIVALSDQYGNAAAQSGVMVTATVPSGYTLLGSSSVQTDATGNATFTGLGVSGPAGSVAISFGASGLTTATATVQVTAGQATSMTPESPTAVTDSAAALVSSAALPAVVLKDASGNPVSGVGVTFRAGSEGGSLGTGLTTAASVVTVTTDAMGVAMVAAWQLPGRTGGASVTASALGLQVVFTATVTSGNAKNLAVAGLPAVAIQSGVPFSSFAVQLRDQYMNNVAQAGVLITLSAAAPYSITSGGSATTAANGLATFVGLTITGPSGQFQVEVSAGGITATFASLQMQAAPGASGPLASLAALNPTQAATVNLLASLSVQALDASSRGVPGVLISWSLTSGAGTLLSNQSTTGDNGIASTTVKLPTKLGTSTFQASAPAGSGVAPAAFTIKLTPMRACDYRWSGGGSAQRGDTLPLPLQLAALDSLGNPVPNASVQLEWNYPIGPHDIYGTFTQVTTDATGLSSTGGTVVLGSFIGTQALTYTAQPCYSNSPQQQYTAGAFTATSSPIASLTTHDSVLTNMPVGVRPNLLVWAWDRHGYYVPNAAVRFQITQGDGAFSNGSLDLTAVTGGAVDNNTGMASASYVVGAAAVQQITVTAPNVMPLIITIKTTP